MEIYCILWFIIYYYIYLCFSKYPRCGLWKAFCVDFYVLSTSSHHFLIDQRTVHLHPHSLPSRVNLKKNFSWFILKCVSLLRRQIPLSVRCFFSSWPEEAGWRHLIQSSCPFLLLGFPWLFSDIDPSDMSPEAWVVIESLLLRVDNSML